MMPFTNTYHIYIYVYAHRAHTRSLQVWESYDGVFCNYFSLGVDATAAAAFHEHREAHPEQFTGQMTNQVLQKYTTSLISFIHECVYLKFLPQL
jgi:Diacylglycerol kinase accessory domain